MRLMLFEHVAQRARGSGDSPVKSQPFAFQSHTFSTYNAFLLFLEFQV